MAKRKGKGLDIGVIKVAGDLVIDSRIKVGAVLWLQEKYDKDFSEIMEHLKKGKFVDVINLVVALALQHNSEKTEAEVRRTISQIDIVELGEIAAQLADAFGADVKNSKRPVKGNIQE